MYRELIELTGGKNGGDGRAIVSAIVRRNLFFKVLIVQGVERLLPVYMLREIE